jgi:glycosyltransferase involved in cell wall biosynthesis
MRIGIDLRFTASSHMGTGTYAEQAALSLLQAARSDDVIVGFTANSSLPDSLHGLELCRIPTPESGRDSHFSGRLVWDSAIDRCGIEVFFTPTGLVPLVRRCAVVTTIHDLLFEHHPEFYAPGLLAHLTREIRRGVRNSDRIVAISQSTKRDLISMYGIDEELIEVIHQGLPSRFFNKLDRTTVEHTTRELGLHHPYVLTLSNHSPHKNTAFAIESFARWINDTGNRSHHLVIAGGGPSPNRPSELQEVVRRLGISERVQILGRISDEALVGLYAGATIFLFPSLFEGWGLPPLEAMALGVPAIVSNCGGLPEAVGNAAIVLSPGDAASWSQAIARLIDHPADALHARMAVRVTEVSRGSGGALRHSLDVAHEHWCRSRDSLAQTNKVSHFVGKNAQRTTPVTKISLSGCMIIRNGLKLGYPFIEAILSVIDHVEEMVVVDGDSQDGTWEILSELAQRCKKLRLFREPWPKTSTGGRVIAEATNQAMRFCTGTHILYVQADEIFTEGILIRLHQLLAGGYDCAAMPFLHFRTGWFKIIANPAYHATLRCVPNRPGVVSAGDATSFQGPVGRCAQPEEFPDYIFHVGWIYEENIIEKHKNHAEIYADNPDYQEKSRLAQAMSENTSEPQALSSIDAEYQLLEFRGVHPSIVRHLIGIPKYHHQSGLDLWKTKFLKS